MQKHGSPDGKNASPWFAKSVQKRRKAGKVAKQSRKVNR